MNDHEPTVTDSVDPDQSGERLDADKLPEEYPDRPLTALDHGTTEAEMAQGQSLDERLARETPDVDQTGGAHLDSTTSTPLLDDAEDGVRDREKDLVAEASIVEPHTDDSGQPTTPVSAEEEAVRVESPDDVPGAVDHDEVRAP